VIRVLLVALTLDDLCGADRESAGPQPSDDGPKRRGLRRHFFRNCFQELGVAGHLLPDRLPSASATSPFPAGALAQGHELGNHLLADERRSGPVQASLRRQLPPDRAGHRGVAVAPAQPQLALVRPAARAGFTGRWMTGSRGPLCLVLGSIFPSGHPAANPCVHAPVHSGSMAHPVESWCCHGHPDLQAARTA